MEVGVGRMRLWRWVLGGRGCGGGCWEDEVVEVGVGRMRSWRWVLEG